LEKEVAVKQYEYDKCAELERELTRGRWSVFTAFTSISFVVAGLSFHFAGNGPTSVSKVAFSFAYLIFLTAVYYYYWMHSKSHDLRDHLIQLEEGLGIQVYTIRVKRPRFMGIRVYFHWVINLWLLFYTFLFIYLVVAK